MDGDREKLDAVTTENETRRARSLARTILFGAFHGLAWMVLLWLMVQRVPDFANIFVDFEVEIPTLTRWVVSVSFFSIRYCSFLLPAVILLCLVNTAVLRVLSVRPGAALLRWSWMGFMFLVPAVLIAVTLVAMFVPLVSLTSSLR